MSEVLTAKCGCKYRIDDTYVYALDLSEPEEWLVIADIPELEAPETPLGWAQENVIWPHEKECAEMQEKWVSEGMKVVNRLLNEMSFQQQYSQGLELFRVVKAVQ